MTEFPKVGFFSKGYHRGQVDAFFEDARRAYEGGLPPEQFSAEQVRLATFELKNRGYNIEAVDAAMNRLEAAFVKRDRADSVAAEGEAAWYDRVADRATTLYPRLQRPAVSVSPTRAAGGATTARPWMICLIVSPPTSTRPGS